MSFRPAPRLRVIALAVAVSLVPALGLAPAPAFAAGQTVPGATQVRSLEGITEYRLPNGLQVLLMPDASKPTTTVNLTIRVGSRNESYGETGMAHLLEHLMFKGSTHYANPGAEFIKRGMRYNGSTWFDRTNYFASFAADDGNLDWYLGWLSDALVNSFIAKRDLDSEMTVVRNEMEMGENSPANILEEKVLSTAYDWHNYGKSTIGARADVENVNIPHLQGFYRRYYQPDNATLIVSGKFDSARTLARISRSFGVIPKPKRTLEPTWTLDPTQDGERSVTLRRAGDTPILMAGYHVPAGSSPDFAAVELAATILGGPSLRLHRALVETDLAAETDEGVYSLAEPGYALFSATLKSDQKPEAARDALLATIEGVRSQPFTAEELERARNQWLRSFERLTADPERVGVELSEFVALGDWRLAFWRRDGIRNAKLVDVQRVAEQYFVQSNRTLGQFVPTTEPQRAPAPARVDVAAELKDYKGDAGVAAGEAFDPSPANIGARTEFTTIAVGDGAPMKLALLDKRTRGQKAVVTIGLRFGDEKSLFGQDVPAATLGMLLGRGTARLTREQLAAEFEKLKASWKVSATSEGAVFTLQVERANLQPALALAAEVLRSPRFDQAEFDQARGAAIAGLEAARNDPEARLSERLEREGNPYPKGDVRYAMSTDESLAELKAARLDDARAFHQKFFGASSSVVAAVGDFDRAELKAQLGQLFGDWKSATPYSRVSRPVYDVQPSDFRIDLKDKQNAVLMAQLQLPLAETDREYQALRLATFMLGTGDGSRLWDRIREKEGLSYGVAAFMAGGQFEPHATWGAQAIFAPQNTARVRKAFDEEVERARRDGFTPQELQRAKAAIRQAAALSRAQDGSLAGVLVSLEERDLRPDYLDRVQTLRDGITLDEVNAALRKSIELKRLVIGVAGSLPPQ
ncbi:MULTISPECIES: M16 family metallopeptidase [Derxia]|uniref:M16 family metallopeptidase n=1 Tax=Derxia gummosa DSM 723 TaxID=1121388 RepID=A0A8B6XCC3_9BURK|nr:MULTISPECIES: pitrilysin family protein [Derxia]